jgi:hypothetical protein
MILAGLMIRVLVIDFSVLSMFLSCLIQPLILFWRDGTKDSAAKIILKPSPQCRHRGEGGGERGEGGLIYVGGEANLVILLEPK